MEVKHNIPEYGVSEFNKIFRDILESNFDYVRIRGEISEVKSAAKGQLYITIKDKNFINKYPERIITMYAEIAK